MAFTIYANEKPGGEIFVASRVHALMLTHGFTVQASSDGTVYSAAGNAINPAAGDPNVLSSYIAGSIGNPSAWVRYRHTALGYELLLQRGTSYGSTWRMLLSPSAGFSGGSPSATQRPTATDERAVLGNTTTGTQDNLYAIPSFGNTLHAARVHMMFGDADENYSFAVVARFLGLGASPGGMGGWFIDNLDASSFDPSDTSTQVIGFFGNVTTTLFDDGAALFDGRAARTPATAVRQAWTFDRTIESGAQMFATSLVTPAASSEYMFDLLDPRHAQNGHGWNLLTMPGYWQIASRQEAGGLANPILRGPSKIFRIASGFTENSYGLGADDRLVIGRFSFPWDPATRVYV
jgi:hypothetical protein